MDVDASKKHVVLLNILAFLLLTVTLQPPTCQKSLVSTKCALRAPMYYSLFIIFCNLLVHFVKFFKSFAEGI